MRNLRIAVVVLLVALLGAGSVYSWPWGGAGGGGSGTTNASDLSSGTLPVARIGDNSILPPKMGATGTPGVTTYLRWGSATGFVWATPTGTGDVVGPASATDSYFALWDNTTGKLLKDGFSSVNPAFSTINVYGANALNLGTAGSIAGSLKFKSGTGSNNYVFNILGSNFGADLTWTLPTAAPAGNSYLLNSSTAGVLAYTDPATFAPSSSTSTATDWNKWDGGATGLTAATGRTSLGLGTADSPTFASITVNSVSSGAADNTHYVNVANTSDPTGANLAAGNAWFNNTTNLWKIRAGDNNSTLSFYPTGTMTDTKTCIYTAGTGVVCNTTPQAGGGDVSGGTTSADGELAAYNGTGGKTLKQSFFAVTGPATSVKTYTLPNASATILTDNVSVTVAQGGTGRATGTTAYALIAVGTTATGAQQTLASGATTEILVGGGASALPAWGTALPNGVTATTQSATDNSTKVATTFYVDRVADLKAPLASPTFTGTVTLPAAFVLATTGTISGAISILDNVTGPTAAQSYGTLNVMTGNATVLLPTAVAGMSMCVQDGLATASDIIVDVQAGDNVVLVGVTQAGGVGITNASGTSLGDYVCLIATAANKWRVYGRQGTWASQ